MPIKGHTLQVQHYPIPVPTPSVALPLPLSLYCQDCAGSILLGYTFLSDNTCGMQRRPGSCSLSAICMVTHNMQQIFLMIFISSIITWYMGGGGGYNSF